MATPSRFERVWTSMLGLEKIDGLTISFEKGEREIDSNRYIALCEN